VSAELRPAVKFKRPGSLSVRRPDEQRQRADKKSGVQGRSARTPEIVGANEVTMELNPNRSVP
jgi:hypothetical protein